MTADLSNEALDALVKRAYAKEPAFDTATVTLLLDLADAITALRDREQAVVAAAVDDTLNAISGPLWRAILSTEDCLNRVCKDRTEVGGCICGPKYDRIMSHARTPFDAAAALDRIRDEQVMIGLRAGAFYADEVYEPLQCLLPFGDEKQNAAAHTGQYEAAERIANAILALTPEQARKMGETP